MEFGWTDEQRRRHRDTLTAVRTGFDAVGGFDRDDWRRLGELGVLGASVPADLGGGGLAALDTARIYEAAGQGCANTGLVFAAAAHLFACAMPIVAFGGEALRKQWLPGMCAGEFVAANAMTESGAGSDVSALTTSATPTDGGFLLNGTKSFVSNGSVADVVVTYASTDQTAGHLGITGFVVGADAPGVAVGPALDKLGLAGCAASTITFHDCFVPRDNVLGAVGQGAAIFQHSMGWERACLFALYLGLQDRLIDQCVDHATQRRQFGKRLAEFQAVAHRIVEMKLRVDSARLLLYRACWAMDVGEPDVLFTALAKLATSEGALASAIDAVRVFGARGYLREHGVEAALRDAVGGTIFSGTSDIQRELAALELGL